MTHTLRARPSRAPRSLVALAAILLIACGDDSTSPELTFAPVIDGVRGPDEWTGATEIPIDEPLGQNVPAGGTIYVGTDGVDLFIGVELPVTEIVGDEGLGVRFDNDNDDVMSEGDDLISVGGDDEMDDLHFSADQSVYVFDAQSDGTAAWSADGENVFFEFAHPLDSGDPGDISVSPGATIGLCIDYAHDAGSDEFPNGCIFAVNQQERYIDVVIEEP